MLDQPCARPYVQNSLAHAEPGFFMAGAIPARWGSVSGTTEEKGQKSVRLKSAFGRAIT